MNDNYAFAGERINAKYWIHISMELIAFDRGLSVCVCVRLCALLMMSHQQQQQQQQHCRKIVSNYAYTGISEQTTHINIYTHTHSAPTNILSTCVCVCALACLTLHISEITTRSLMATTSICVGFRSEYIRVLNPRAYVRSEIVRHECVCVCVLARE